MLVTVDTIRKPTKIRAGAVAKLGIEQKIGDSTTEIKNKNPVTTEEKPVLAPAATPEELSTNVVVVEVPSTAPAVVCNRIRQQRFLDARQSAVLVQHIRLVCHRLTFRSVSNISTNRNAHTTAIKSKNMHTGEIQFKALSECLTDRGQIGKSSAGYKE